MKTIIYSPFDCVIKSKDEQLYLSKNEHLCLDDDQTLSVYPVGKTSRYAFNIPSDGEGQFYKKVLSDNATLIFLIDGLLSESVCLKSYSFEGKSCQVKIGSHSIDFCTPDEEKRICLPQRISDASCGQFSQIVYAHCLEQNFQRLIAFNILTGKARLFHGEKIELSKEGFTIFNKAIEKEYCVDNDGLKIKSFHALEKNSADFVVSKFFFFLKELDFVSAYELLSPSLKNTLTIQNFKDFFGHISYYYLIDKNTCFALSDEKNIIYNIEIDGQKIVDISNDKG